MRKKFFDLFPPPKYLSMPSIGLSLSDSHIRFVSLRPAEGSFVLGTYAERELPVGAVDAGYVHKPDEIVKVLKALKKEFGLKFVEVTLPEEKAFVYKTQVPAGNNAELKSSVEFTIEENVPVMANEAVSDFTILNKITDQNKEDLMVAIVPQKVVDTYTALFTQADLVVKAFELESQAIARSVISIGDPNLYLIVNFERFKTGFYVSLGNTILFTSTIQATNKDLTLITEEIDKIFLHIKSDKKLESKNQGGSIAEIILCGEGAVGEGVREHIWTSVGIPVEVANVWRNIFVFNEYVPDISQKDSLPFAAAVGLALRATHRVGTPEQAGTNKLVNLLSSDIKNTQHKEYSYRKKIVFFSALVCVFVMNIVFLVPSYVLSNIKLSDVQGQAESLQKQADEAEQAQSANIIFKEVNALLLKAEPITSRTPSSEVLRTLIEQKNDGIRIATLTVSLGDKENLGTLSISGLAKDRESLDKFLNSVRSVEIFKEVNLPVSSFTKLKDIQFTMDINGEF